MEQKTVLITGASGGIGREAARRFAARGYAVAMHYHSGEGEALRLAEELSAGGHRVLHPGRPAQWGRGRGDA